MNGQVRVVDLVDLTSSPETSPQPIRKRSPVAVASVAAAASGVAGIRPVIFLGSDDDDSMTSVGFGAQPHRKRQRRRQQLAATTNHSSSHGPKPPARFKTDRDDDGNPIILPPPPPPPVIPVLPEHTVLEYFPDADLTHVQNLLKKHVNADGTNTPNIAVVINTMAENGYEKCKQGRFFIPVTAAAAGATTSAAATGAAAVIRTNNNNLGNNDNVGGSMLDFMSTESFPVESDYRNQAQAQLEYDFPCLSANGARAILQSCKHHYAIAHDRIVAALKGTTVDARAGESSLEETQYNRLLTGMSGNHIEADQMKRLEALVKSKGKACLKHARKNKAAPTISHAILVQEIQYVQKKLAVFLETGRRVKKRKMDQVKAQKDHTAVDCSCCFDGFPVADMVACREEGHLFCIDCLRTCVEEQIFGQGNLGIDKTTKKPAHEIQCFHGSGCSSGFLRALLAKALPEKTLAKYDELQFKVSLEAAGLSLVSCPKCAFQVELPAGQKILTCPVLGCGFESCRECGGPAHIPLRCEEVKKEEKETTGRLVVEEAITAAKIRHCYKCNQPFVKSEGCNKITCSCGAKQCYVCRQPLSDYSHFCQTFDCRHTSCNKCPLYSNAEEDDVREMREAGLKAAQEVRAKIQQESHMEVDIDVDQILKKPPPAGRGR